MAFNVFNWGTAYSGSDLLLQNGMPGGNPSLFTYITLVDTLAAVEVPNYFAQQTPIVEAGDFIFVTATNGSQLFTVLTSSAALDAITIGPAIVPPDVTPVIDVVATPELMAPGNIYVADTAGLLTFDMPAIVPFGSIFEIVGKGAGGWDILLSAGQTAHLNSVATSAGGNIASTEQWNCCRLICVTANTTFTIDASEGVLNLT